MAKKRTEFVTDSVDSLKPYLERALKDDHFKEDLRDALEAARDIWGDLQKGNGGLASSASKFATSKDVQENLRRAMEDLESAGDRLKGNKKSHKVRNSMLVAGVVAGALYNPWTGEQTRKWVMDKIAGGDDLQPLESYEPISTTASTETKAGDTVTVDTTSTDKK